MPTNQKKKSINWFQVIQHFGRGGCGAAFTRLQCPDVSLYLFQNFDPTPSGSGCICTTMWHNRKWGSLLKHAAPSVIGHVIAAPTCCLCGIPTPGIGCRPSHQHFPSSVCLVHRWLDKRKKVQVKKRFKRFLKTAWGRGSWPTCAWDDDDEAATAGQMSDEIQMLAESSGVRHQVGRHGGLGLGLLKAAL